MADKSPSTQIDARPIVPVTLTQKDGTLYNASAGTGGTSQLDNSAFTYGLSSVNPEGIVVAASIAAAAFGNVVIPKGSTNRVPFAIVYDAAGNERGANVTALNELLVSINSGSLNATAFGSVNVTGTVTLGANPTVTIANTLTVSGSVNVGAAAADQSAFTYGTTITPVNGYVVAASVANVTFGQQAAAKMSQNRVAYTIVRDNAGNERGANVTAANELLVSANSGTINVAPPGNRTPTQAPIAIAASQAIGPGASGHTFRITNIFTISSGVTTLSFYDGATAISGSMAVATNSGFSAQGSYDAPVFMTNTASNAFGMSATSSVAVAGALTYYVI